MPLHRFYRNTFRVLRLQVKSGFREEPPEFTIMKRYPPMFRNNAPKRSESATRHRIPYMKLFRKAMDKNPLFADETVYPAYWNYEPSALTLAKKQYEHIKAGMDEESAYKKAVEYIDELENASYESIIDFKKLIESADATKPIVSDPAVLEEIAFWKQKLATTKYTEMELADQGDIDKFLQMDILKWNEVERERRMRDPMFVIQFEGVRNAIFPEIAKATEENFDFEEFKYGVSKIYETHGQEEYNTARWRATKPFYYEDYAVFFEKIAKNPTISSWPREDVQAFRNWVADTLAMQLDLEGTSLDDTEIYLQDLQEQYFPMLRNPDAKKEFELPDELAFRTKLFENNIGYKREGNGKLYVRRFYRIPALFFPESEEDFYARIIDKFTDPVDEALFEGPEKDSVQLAASASSLSEKVELPGEDQQAIQDMHKKHGLRAQSTVGTESVAHRLFESINSAREMDAARVPSVSAPAQVASAYDDIEDVASMSTNSTKEQSFLTNKDGLITLEDHPDEFKKFFEKHYKAPRTRLERDRDLWFSAAEPVGHEIEGAKDSSEVLSLTGTRMDSMLMVRAELAMKYEEKEAARRVREWKLRGVVPPFNMGLITK